ncbi:MAG: DUF4340 domain-containing protein [Planctomycetes bacterium]|nr:DUF4340 domain-containing protein [Planctomycetota bacterium]
MIRLHRRNLLLLIVALVLAVPTVLRLRAEADEFVDVGRIPLMFDGFTADNVARILLARPKAEQPEPPTGVDQTQPKHVAYDFLALQHDERGWSVAPIPGQAPGDLVGAPVSKALVESDLLQHLASIPDDEGALAQPDATDDQLKEFGLDDAHAYVIRATNAANTVVAELLVGRDSGVGQVGTEAVRGVFVRKGGSRDVVLYEWQKPWRRDVTADGWLDRTVFRLDPTKVRRLSLRNASTGARPIVFERPGNQASWRLATPRDDLGAVRQAEIEAIVQQRLSYVTVQRYVRPLSRAGDMAALGLFPPQVEVVLTVVDGGEERAIELAVGERVPDGNEFYLTCSESQFLMTWPASTAVAFELDVERRLFDPKGQ